MKLTPQQLRILRVLSNAVDPVTRSLMKSNASEKGFSEALGSPRTGIRPESLEAKGLVQRLDSKVPYRYVITPSGLAELMHREQVGSVRRRVARMESEDELNATLEEQVADALSLPISERRRLLNAYPRIPELVPVSTARFRRNPYVVAEVLYRANGVCGRCSEAAPFVRRSDGKPFLEVHHKLPLAEGGEDTVENAIALCPNCHREAHYA